MANLKINILAKDQTKNAMRSVKGGLASIKNAVFSLKGAFVTLGTGVALRSIANVGSNFEDLRDSLASVTGGVRQGAEAFDFITRFSLKSQFSVEQLTTSFITLKASGIEPTEKLLRMFTDTSAVTTDQIGTLDAMTRVFSRGIQGGLGLEELNQIADRGVPVFKILEEQLGITRLEIAKFGQTTEGAKKILDALQVGFSQAFGGATEQKLDNLSTSSSNLGIAFRNSLDVIGQSGFSGALTTMNNTLSETLTLLTPVAQLLGKGLGLVIKGLTKALETLNIAIQKSFNLYKDLREFLGIPLPEITIKKGKMPNIHEGMKIPDTRTDIDKIKEALETEVKKRVETLGDEFKKIHETIGKGIVAGIGQMSRGMAETLVLGKSFAETLKKIAQNILINIIAKQIEHLTLLGIEKILRKENNEKEAEKDNLIRKQNTNLKRQIALQLILNALGGGGGGSPNANSNPFKMFASGGAVSKGQPTIVGERGAELFIPNSSGQITQSARGTSGGQTTVNFNINTLDASGFDDLLVRNRGTITQIINNAVNERGSKNLI